MSLFSKNCLVVLSSVCVTLLLNSGCLNSTLAHESKSRNFPTGTREGAGVRGEMFDLCQNAALPSIDLLGPQSSVLTVAEVPNLLFYLSPSNRPQSLKFILLNRQKKIVYQKSFTSKTRAKIVSSLAPISKNSEILAIDRPYNWYIVKECSFSRVPQILLHGSLTRVKLDRHFHDLLKQAKPSERVQLYREVDMWSEALNDLLNRYCEFDNRVSIEPSLMTFLKSAKLYRIDRQALNSYCRE